MAQTETPTTAHFERLREIRALKKGWDSYEAEPPGEIACDLAGTLLGMLERHSLPVAFITATSESSILVKHGANGSAVTWEIDPDGETGVIVESAGAATRFRSPSAQEIGTLVEELARAEIQADRVDFLNDPAFGSSKGFRTVDSVELVRRLREEWERGA